MSAPTNGSRRWQFGLRDLFMGFAAIAVYLAAYVLIFRGLSNREIVELAGAAAASLLGTILAVVLLRAWLRYRAGPVVAHVRREMSREIGFAWACSLPLVVILFVPIVSLLATWQEAKTGGTTWPSFVRGLLVVWITQWACFVCFFVLQRTLDICEGGFVYYGAFFVPWRKIRQGTWSFDQQGNLVGGLPGRQMVAYVPPEQRAAVEALLKEKLGQHCLAGDSDGSA